MRFGVFDQLEVSDVPLHQLYRERLAFIEQCDQAGIWCYHKSEHHFIPLDAAPNPTVFLAAAAERTTSIRLGPLVYLLPFHHPLRLAEDICMLDHLSGGRVELGVGRGISIPEIELWGLDPEAAQARYEESLEVVLQALQSSSLTHEGTHFSFRDVPIQLAPFQRPFPPLWYPGNIETAAKAGMSTIIGGPLPVVTEKIAQYREQLRPRTDSSHEPSIGVVHRVYVADTDAEARARVRSTWATMTARLTPLFKQWNLIPPNDPTLGGDVDLALRLNVCLAGSPATVRAYVEQFEAESGTDYFVGCFTWGDLTHEESTRSFARFAVHVMR